MSWRTHRLVVMLRSFGRALGLNRWIAAWLSAGEGYEACYDSSFSGGLRPGDSVWDVGANVGYYTRLFARRVREQGHVFAFEPSPTNFQRLATACTELRNVTLLPCGLGREDGKLRFQQGADALGATSRITESASDGINVDIRSGASLLASGEVTLPNAIKIDVEGFELEVLEGMADSLRQPPLRMIGVEVHFGILQQRGMALVPQQIESLLQRSGFVVSWPDGSHILAVRATV